MNGAIATRVVTTTTSSTDAGNVTLSVPEIELPHTDDEAQSRTSTSESPVNDSDQQRERGWRFLRENRELVLEYGRKDGAHRASWNAGGANTTDEGQKDQKVETRPDIILPPTRPDSSLIHSAVPFLPLSAAFFCCFCNIFVPGLGTILSGFFLLCMGQPRILYRESRVALSIVTNILIGVAQMSTITFLLVGWFWSLSWGGLLVMHAFEYRQAVLDSRKEAVATAAIEALTKDTILHRKDVVGLIRKARENP